MRVLYLYTRQVGAYFFEASYEKGSSPLQTLFSVVTLDGLRLYDHAGVGFLPVLAFGSDRSCHVARTQSKGSAECLQ